MDKYLLWLDQIEGLGAGAKRNLLSAFGSACDVYKGSEKLLSMILEEKKLGLFLKARKELNAEALYRYALQEKISFVCDEDDLFPDKLRQIPDPPFGLYYKGKLPQEEIPSVAVIGARECSAYGEYVAKELGKLLGECGLQVISGMAKGIDGITQQAAIDAGGISFGILGCGVDICYPKSNQHLYKDLIKNGGILSAYPPGTQPQSRLFPPRNRIVSGLADVLVVIEARQKSGTYITVEMALEQGKEIYAVPGRVTDRLSDGCNKMIKDGAHVFLSPKDFLLDLQELFPFSVLNTKKRKGNGAVNDGDSEETEDVITSALLEVLDFYPQPVDLLAQQLVQKHGISMKTEELASQLMVLCLYGKAVQESAGWFRKR